MTTQTATGYGITEMLEKLGLQPVNPGASTGTQWLSTKGDVLPSLSPCDGEEIASVQQATTVNYVRIVALSQEAFRTWRRVPAPKRGEVVRQMGDALRQWKEPLGRLVSYETGKIYQEGLGEVQEMIDICDFAVGLSRQLYGLTMHSERPKHR